MKRLILILTLAGLAFSAQAQTAKSRANLYTEIDAQLASGTAITASTLRGVFKNTVASSRNDITDGTSITSSQIADATAVGRALLTAASVNAQQTALLLVPGTNVQAFDADLSTYAGITPSANVQTLLGSADYAAMRTSLGLVIGTNVQAYDADLTTYAGITPAANTQTLLAGANYAAWRTNLGLIIGSDVQAFDAALTAIAGGSDFVTFSGPATSTKTFTLPNASSTILTSNAAVTVGQGGTGQTSYTDGQLLIGNTTGNTLAKSTLTAGSGVTITNGSGTITISATGTGTGDVSSASNFGTDNVLIKSDGTTKGVQATGISVDDSNNVTGIAGLTATTMTFTNVSGSGTIPVANGGTGSATAANARTALGLAIGTNVQAYDADLTTYAGITPAANTQTFLGAADYAAMRTQLALTIGTNVQAYDADLTTWAGVTPGTGVGTFLATPSSANLRAALTDENGTGAAMFAGGNIGAGSATTASAGDSSTLIATTAFVQGEVDATHTGTHASPSTTNPLSPTWTGPMHTVWYGATGTINLPAASTYADRGILVYNTGAFTITIDANGSEVIVRDGTVQTGGVSMTLASGAGNYVALYCDGVRWVTVGFKGTLAAGS